LGREKAVLAAPKQVTGLMNQGVGALRQEGDKHIPLFLSWHRGERK
jgi:hypothetical protein